jgi:ADP-heptose:LPS heptosyltransferase
VSQVIERGAALPFFDFHCPLMSLPLAFGSELATIPATVPYLRPDQLRLSKWRSRLPQTGRLRVGLCWTGSGEHLNDHNRSIPLASLVSLLAVSGIDFVSMQKDVDPVQAEILQDYGVLSLDRELADFADTAAGLTLLDLVVAVDTSVAHLAGAVGKVVALLLPFSPDWRWLLDRADSVWYPTMRIFRQAALQDWSEPVERLRQELAEAAERRMARS